MDRFLQSRIEAQIASDGALAPVSGLANKLPEHAARLAAVLALVADVEANEIAADHMSAGIVLAQHYAAEALRMFEGSQVGADLLLAQKLLGLATRPLERKRNIATGHLSERPQRHPRQGHGHEARGDSRRSWLASFGLKAALWLRASIAVTLGGSLKVSAMAGFAKFDPGAFLESEKRAGCECRSCLNEKDAPRAANNHKTLATLATLAASPPQNENQDVGQSSATAEHHHHGENRKSASCPC